VAARTHQATATTAALDPALPARPHRNKAISIEGGFEITNLMAVAPKAPPVSIVNAIIDLDFVRGPAVRSASDDVIEI
jgi:hypothetical protein